MGIPRSQIKMYPVAPASLILFVKRMSDPFLTLLITLLRGNLLRLMKTHNRACGWLSGQTKSDRPCDDYLDLPDLDDVKQRN